MYTYIVYFGSSMLEPQRLKITGMYVLSTRIACLLLSEMDRGRATRGKSQTKQKQTKKTRDVTKKGSREKTLRNSHFRLERNSDRHPRSHIFQPRKVRTLS